MNQKVRFCEQCGAEIIQGSAYCNNCGNKIDYANSGNRDIGTYDWQGLFQRGMYVIHKISTKEKISTGIWLGIACIQVLLGFAFYFAWVAAVWNFLVCFLNYRFIKKMDGHPVGIYTHYNDALFSIISTMIFNFIVGGAIGVIGGIYDLTIRSYAMQNKEALLCVDVVYTQKNTEFSRM